MPLDSTFLIKVKEHVTRKLKSLGAFIDEELPDYIMVMVANKKSEASMSKDLQLFLGDHTIEFTKWLHTTLDDLKRSERDKPKQERQEKREHKTSKRKSLKTDAHPSEEHVDLHMESPRRSRSRSPLTASKHATMVTSSREPHGDMELFNIHVDEDYSMNDESLISDTTPEKRQVVSTASLNRENRHDVVVGSSEESSNIRSIVKTKQDLRLDRSANQSSQPSGRLLQRAVFEAKSTVPKPEISHPRPTLAEREAQRRPADSSHVSSSVTTVSQNSTRFFVTLSGNGRPSAVCSSAADSSVGPNWSSIDDEADERRCISRTARISGNVRSRLGQRILPMSGAMRPRARDRLGPISSSAFAAEDQRRIGVTYADIADGEDAFDQDEDIVELVEGEDFDDFDVLEAKQRHVITDGLGPTTASRIGSMPRLVDRFQQKQLIVNLNDETEMHEDDMAPLAREDERWTVEKQRMSGKLNASDELDHIPSNLERCRYWPTCRNGDKCEYIHPSKPCATFPNCRMGSNCTYIHPKCRYANLCTRPGCAYTHSTKHTIERAAPVQTAPTTVPQSQIVCRFRGSCTNAFCPYYHPPIPRLLSTSPAAVAVSTTPAINTTHNPAKNPDTTLTTSPVVCRYGSACRHRHSGCPFTHLDRPTLNQLKWVAQSKQTAKDGTTAASGDSTVTGAMLVEMETSNVDVSLETRT